MSMHDRRRAGTSRWRSCTLERLEPRVVLSAVLDMLPLEPPEFNNYGPHLDDFPSNSPLTAADTFKLQSRPGSNFTLLLDFDGHITENSSWNGSYELETIVSPAFDFDGHADTFSTSELARIRDVWKRVTEDYAPFDVNVTTIDPGVAALVRAGAGDEQWGVRVVITEDNFASCNCGGFAYISSFGSSYAQPAFVFNESLDGVSEAVSHEVGHTLSLSHDGTVDPTVEYYRGHGSGATDWCPIMGAGYATDVTSWDNGEYYHTSNGGSGANYGRGPDDLAVITASNGFGYVPDDHGDTTSQATELYVTNGTEVSGFGVIEQNTDLDLFAFDVDTGLLSLTVSPLASRPNLDVWAGIYDSTGTLVEQSNPLDTLTATFADVALSAGRYYLKIDGVSSHAVYDAETDTVNDPPSPAPWQVASPVGYSGYGSLGQYKIAGTIVPPTTNMFTLAALDASKSEGNDGGTSFTFNVTRSGDTSVAASVDYLVRAAHPSAPGENYPWRVDAGDFVGGIIPSGTVEFLPDELTKTITIPVVGDETFEFDEPFFVVLHNPTTGWGYETSAATGTILSDENRLALAPANPPSVRQDEGGTVTDFTFTVTRVGDLSVNTTVDWDVATTSLPYPASANDFVGNVLPSGRVTFASGSASQTVVVQVAGDMNLEPDEQFTVQLLNPQSSVPVTIHAPFASQSGTILNDDVSPVVDFGDAPDTPYGTLLASNGARHTATYPFLGRLIDAEADGQPTAFANGDQQDDDGIVFLDPLIPGTTARFQVTSSAGGGILNYFVDFDRTNGFGNSTDELFSAVLVGGTEILSIDVPAMAVAGPSFARFRLSTAGGLAPGGAAVDGEVEDYAITIFAAAPERDYGDAPDAPYQTLDASQGANHAIGGPQLGNTVDAEPDALPDSTSTGDGRDDDGVRFKELLQVGQTSHIEVTAPVGGVLDCFWDFDRDGTFGNTADETFHVELTPGTQLISVAVPVSATPGTTYARFRLSSAGYLSPLGLGFDGETEDYQLLILPDPTAIFPASEDFDSVTVPSLPAGWTSTSTTQAHWRTASGSSDTTPNHAEVAATNVASENRLTSPVITIEPGMAELQFRNHYDFEASWDGGVLEISVDGAAAIDILDAGCTFVTGGYNHTLGVGSGNPLGGRSAWSADSRGYIDTIVSLPESLAGHSVQFHWVEGTDDGTSDVGWKIDSIQLTGLVVYSWDYGDAPAPYPTLAADSGAAHVLGGSVTLGAAVDANDDGSPTTYATGDDADAAGDDENGIRFLSPLVPGQTAAVRVAAQQAALLNAWIDFNADGDWLDEGEHVFADLPVSAASNELEFPVPASAAITDALIARFRLSTQSALSFAGQAPDGEVEDRTIGVSGTVVGRHIFYNRSAWDGNHAGANAADDQAIATDKTPLLPGQLATFANYTSYSRGINGIMIDIVDLADPDSLSVADFVFRAGNDQPPADWPLLDLDLASISLSVRPGAGALGSDRVTIIFPDGAIRKTWLQVTVKDSAATGLLTPDVHYWGNAVADSGNSTIDTAVNVYDALGVRANLRSIFKPAPIDNRYDYNRDKQVNVYDELLVRANLTSPLSDLHLLDLRPKN